MLQLTNPELKGIPVAQLVRFSLAVRRSLVRIQQGVPLSSVLSTIERFKGWVPSKSLEKVRTRGYPRKLVFKKTQSRTQVTDKVEDYMQQLMSARSNVSIYTTQHFILLIQARSAVSFHIG